MPPQPENIETTVYSLLQRLRQQSRTGKDILELGVQRIARLLPLHSLLHMLAANRNCESFAKQVLLCGRLPTSQYLTETCGEEIAKEVHFGTWMKGRGAESKLRLGGAVDLFHHKRDVRAITDLLPNRCEDISTVHRRELRPSPETNAFPAANFSPLFDNI